MVFVGLISFTVHIHLPLSVIHKCVCMSVNYACLIFMIKFHIYNKLLKGIWQGIHLKYLDPIIFQKS